MSDKSGLIGAHYANFEPLHVQNNLKIGFSFLFTFSGCDTEELWAAPFLTLFMTFSFAALFRKGKKKKCEMRKEYLMVMLLYFKTHSPSLN